MPQLNTYVQNRLIKWAAWRLWGDSGKPPRVVSWYEKVVMAPNVQGRGGSGNDKCPVDEVEAYETDRCVSALSPYLRETVIECYTRSGTAEHKAKQLGISRDTFYERLRTAENKLLGYMGDVACGTALPMPQPNHKLAKSRPKNNSCKYPTLSVHFAA
jgi:hypothetical protein